MFAFCCFVPFSGGDRQGKTASNPPADSQHSQSAAVGAGDGAAQRKEAVRCLAAKVPQSTSSHVQRSIDVSARLPISFPASENNPNMNTDLISESDITLPIQLAPH